MAQSSNHVYSSSSSESSEDEEEARKIREALCDESIFKVAKTVDRNNQRASGAEQLKKREAKVGPLQVEEKQKPALKSNRLQDKNDREDDNVLHTTPEFRAYVAKQLSNVLDSVLADSIMDKVWHVPPSEGAKTNTGIRLFSDSKTLCKVDVQNEVKVSQQEPVTHKPRPHKLSTSSESSEDEKISACIFSVTDIQKESECLAMLEKQTAAKENEKSLSEPDSNIKSTVDQVLHNSTVHNDRSIDKRKKKRRKKKNKTKANGIT